MRGDLPSQRCLRDTTVQRGFTFTHRAVSDGQWSVRSPAEESTRPAAWRLAETPTAKNQQHTGAFFCLLFCFYCANNLDEAPQQRQFVVLFPIWESSFDRPQFFCCCCFKRSFHHFLAARLLSQEALSVARRCRRVWTVRGRSLCEQKENICLNLRFQLKAKKQNKTKKLMLIVFLCKLTLAIKRFDVNFFAGWIQCWSRQRAFCNLNIYSVAGYTKAERQICDPGRDSVLSPSYRLRLHNSYHSRFPAIDLFPRDKVYSCCIINSDIKTTSCRLQFIERNAA